MRFPRSWTALALVALSVGCGGSDDPTIAPPSIPTPGAAAPATTEAVPTAAASTEAATTTGGPSGVEVTGAAGAKPTITLPDGAPPAELVIEDLIVGDGAEAPPGATVTTHYVGVSWLNGGEQFDASWDRGEPIEFPLDGVIAGWTEGIPGMRIGGRRLLVIPPAMGYGANPPTPAIAPNDTLVFVIDLVAVS